MARSPHRFRRALQNFSSPHSEIQTIILKTRDLAVLPHSPSLKMVKFLGKSAAT